MIVLVVVVVAAMIILVSAVLVVVMLLLVFLRVIVDMDVYYFGLDMVVVVVRRRWRRRNWVYHGLVGLDRLEGLYGRLDGRRQDDWNHLWLLLFLLVLQPLEQAAYNPIVYAAVALELSLSTVRVDHLAACVLVHNSDSLSVRILAQHEGCSLSLLLLLLLLFLQLSKGVVGEESGKSKQADQTDTCELIACFHLDDLLS